MRPFAALVVGLALSAILLGFAPQAAAAAPVVRCYVSGPIPSSVSWTNVCTWVMYGNVTVMPPATLTVDPGVTVLADPAVLLYVRGTLVADGLPLSPITFGPNRTISVMPWGGVEFDAGGSGSVSWSTFDHVDRAVTAFGTSPYIHDNTVLQANVGFAFLSASTSVVSNNAIVRAAAVGVYVNASDVQVLGNAINGTATGIQVEQAGSPTISGNTITNVTAGLAVGIFVANGATADVTGNTISGVRGTAGANGAAPGENGRAGGFALAVYVMSATSATITGNTIDTVLGGNGGNGVANATGVGGRGGRGGAAAGIVVGATPMVTVQSNTVTGVSGGRGGAGGGSPTTSIGGRGGDAGEAAGIELAFTDVVAQVRLNTLDVVTGGGGGSGGLGSLLDGSGGVGGDGYGVFLISADQADASSNTVRTIQGGFGGNTSSDATSNGNGARGGAATGISIFSVVQSATIHANSFVTVTGGAGGRGQSGGRGGNATGIVALGNNDKKFNVTSVTFNLVDTLAGGQGGIGRLIGGDGGSAAGVGVIFVTPTLASNSLSSVRGGRGGDALDNTNGGRGGDATGAIGGVVAKGWSSDDMITGVTKGAAGTGLPVQPSYGNGFYLLGNATFTTGFTIENATFASVDSYEFFVDNYTEAVARNTPFASWSVQASGNLTVQNFLEVDVHWPNGLTSVAGASVLVEDNGVTVWNRVAPSGTQSWILVTDRVYINSNTAKENNTTVTVSYLSYVFLNNGRAVNMATSHTEIFNMRDQASPTSAATALPSYENTFSFFVGYTASDGNGTGLRNITLWYRTGGSGGWTAFATQPAGLSGQFTFIASADGLYEFATTADDTTGNTQPGPSANNSWTIVDTVRPASHVVPLAQYETAYSFLVTWGPDGGVTDIATYTIQYDTGSGWVTWLVGVPYTSGTFAAPSEGLYNFRSVATDQAGNAEIAPSGNDTWTIVDVTRPYATNSAPLGANTSTTPVIEITFSEPMDQAAVESAFSITSGMSGTFIWSADSRVMTFLPSGPLQAGTTYTVVVSVQASDRAGNQMLQALTFQFSTVSPPASAFSLSDFWWLFLIVGPVLGGGLLLLMRRRTATGSTPPVTPPAVQKGSEAIIEDVFLLNHRDGILIKHETRRLRPDVDTDILTGMLTAVQAFVKDALRGDENEDLNEMTVGHMHILIGRGKWLVLAARIEGDGSESWTGQIERCIKDMEDHHWDQLEDWDGDMALARVLTPYVKKLIQGRYALVEA